MSPQSRQAVHLRKKSLQTLQDITVGLPVRVDDDNHNSWVVRTRTDDDIKFASPRFQVAHAFLNGYREGYVAALDGVATEAVANARRAGDR